MIEVEFGMNYSSFLIVKIWPLAVFVYKFWKIEYCRGSNFVTFALRVRQSELNMADLGSAILCVFGEQKFVFQLCLCIYMLHCIKIHFDNKSKPYKTSEALGEDFRVKF